MAVTIKTAKGLVQVGIIKLEELVVISSGSTSKRQGSNIHECSRSLEVLQIAKISHERKYPGTFVISDGLCVWIVKTYLDPITAAPGKKIRLMRAYASPVRVATTILSQYHIHKHPKFIDSYH